MGSLTLNGSTSGQVTISPPAVAGTTAISLPAVTGGSFIVSDSSGNVGIGNTPANYQLQLYKGGAVANYLQITSGATGSGAANGTLVGVDASGNGIVTVQGSVNYITSVAGVERMRITSTGGVSFGSSGTAYGTSGQVLTSAGNAPPTWSSVSAMGGSSQTWQSVTRTSGTTYTNSTGSGIAGYVYSTNSAWGGSITVNGVQIAGWSNGGGGTYWPLFYTVPAGATYVISSSYAYTVTEMR